MRADDIDQRVAAIKEIALHVRADRDEVEALLECLDSEHKLVQRRAAETFALLAQHDVAVRPVLVAALQSAGAPKRWGAAYALGLIGTLPREAVPVLIETLGAGDGDLRWAAADILARGASHLGVERELLRLLREGTTPQRKMAAYCLRDMNMRFPELDAALLSSLHDEDVTVRLAAVAALGRVACEREAVAHSLATLLDDVDSGVRRASAVALGDLGDRSEQVRAALRLATHSPDASLRRAAQRSLRVLGG